MFYRGFNLMKETFDRLGIIMKGGEGYDIKTNV